jgi:hypothetical protein
MAKKKHIIESVTLIKVERDYKAGSNPKYYYDIKLSDMEQSLIFETREDFNAFSLIGNKVTYTLDSDNNVIDFDFH